MEKIVESLLASDLEMAMSNCVLRQCGSEVPIVHEGPGLLTQDKNGCIQLRVFASGVQDPLYAFTSLFNQDKTPGELMPDSHYYDFEGRDPYGAVWRAEKISIAVDYGSGTYVRARPRVLEKIDERMLPSERSIVVAFLPEKIELPWHAVSDKGDRGWTVNRFEKKGDLFEWKVVKEDNGVWLSFAFDGVPIERAFDAFLYGLAILTGKWLNPIFLTIHTVGRQQTKIVNRLHKPDIDHLLPPIGLQRGNEEDAHRFLERFVGKAMQEIGEESLCDLVIRYWHRILRSRINDIENSSLVLSVAIEGFIKKTLLSKSKVDAEFLEQLQHVEGILKNVSLGKRALGCVLSSLGNAKKPRVQDVLLQLVSAGSAAEIHLASWKGLRHAAAHGALLNNDEKALQEHLDRFYACLDLYYRLVFLAIGYDGKHIDYGARGWPTREFRTVGAN